LSDPQKGDFEFNILSASNYEKRIISETETYHLIVFTNANYENAEPIGK